jgi:hypothetical protein
MGPAAKIRASISFGSQRMMGSEPDMGEDVLIEVHPGAISVSSGRQG